jgi:hypothetical protein
MNKRPGRVNVTTEAGFCNFCGRPRNLRHEEHQLGNFIRTVVTCETCHRTLSSTMGVATADAPAEVEAAAPAQETASPEPKPARAAARKSGPPSGKPKATKPRAAKSK